MVLGPIAFLSSGETAAAGGALFEGLAAAQPRPLRIAILETPAGFELNSDQVAGRIADFMKARLQAWMPEVAVIAARKRGTPLSPDEPDVLEPLLHANLIFMGPGSPTYAIRQLHGSLAWDLIRARQRLGAALVFASAAAIAVGAWGLPVYEVYKAGEDIHSVAGLDLFTDFGMQLSFVSHWNNTDGGKDLDTSRCFMGAKRFEIWRESLPMANTTVGLDEHTSLIFDFETRICEVKGVSGVTLVGDAAPKVHPSGARFPMSDLGAWRPPVPIEKGISAVAWEMAIGAVAITDQQPPEAVVALANARQKARMAKDWEMSDKLRDQLAVLGWTVRDTETGPRLVRQ